MLHSLLFVPAKEKMLKKLGNLGADAYIIDLEDSIEDENKEEALLAVINTLNDLKYENIRIIVRINKNRYMQDIEALLKFNVGFMLPKFEHPSEYENIREISNNHYIYALIETPKGLVFLSEIASCEYVHALAFGAEDFTAFVGMANEIQYLRYQKSCIITFARAYGKKVFDTPSFQLDDCNKFQLEVEESRKLGFDGKMAINPRHLQYINECFSDGDLDVMKAIVEEYEQKQQAVLVINGKIYEKMHICHMKKIIKEKAEYNNGAIWKESSFKSC